MQYVTAYLLTGSNLGCKLINLIEAAQLIDDTTHCMVIEASSVYRTAPWGYKNQPAFYNQALKIRTTLPPYILLKRMKAIEQKMGRKPNEKWRSRLIDIDILLYGNEKVSANELTIPHPGLHVRKFALSCLSEIAGNVKHPVHAQTITKLAQNCSDHSLVIKL